MLLLLLLHRTVPFIGQEPGSCSGRAPEWPICLNAVVITTKLYQIRDAGNDRHADTALQCRDICQVAAIHAAAASACEALHPSWRKPVSLIGSSAWLL